MVQVFESICRSALHATGADDAVAAVFRGPDAAACRLFASAGGVAPEHPSEDGAQVPIVVGSVRWGWLWLSGPAGAVRLRVLDAFARHAAVCIADRRQGHAQVMGGLSAGMTHDLNNILAGIIANAEMMRCCIEGNPEAAEALDAILAGARRGTDMATRLSGLVAASAGQARRADLGGRILQAMSMVRDTLGPGIHLDLHLDQPLPPVYADPDSIGHALVCLCLNAAETMPPVGRIVVRTLCETLGRHRGAAVLLPGRYAVIQVADTGSDPVPDEPALLFEPMFQPRPGSFVRCVGLWTVYCAMERCGGAAFVEPDPETGRRVSLYLPVAGEE